MGSKGRDDGSTLHEGMGSGEQGGFINLEFSDRIWAFLGVAHVDKKKQFLNRN